MCTFANFFTPSRPLISLQPLWSKAYSWDQNGANLLSVTDQISGNVRQFSYDYVNRLASTTDASGGVADTYTFDAWGNHVESGTFNFVPSANGTNRINATGYVYDLSGNMTADGLGNTYSYDADGKMSASNGAVYTRDSFGQRVRKDYSGAATEYFYFGGELLATRNPSSSQWTDYIYAEGRLIAEIPVTSTDTPFYRIGDHLDSLAQKTDSAGNLLGTNDVSPYGELFSGTASDRLIFTQHERDAENSSDSALYRQYASTQGRWLSPDPYNGSYSLSDPQSLNRYTYLSGRPLSSVDPDGLDGVWDTILEIISVGQYDPDDSKKRTGSSPAEEGYGVANPGNPFIFSEYVNGYGGVGGGFDTNLLGVAAYSIPGGLLHSAVCSVAAPLLGAARGARGTVGVGAGGSAGVLFGFGGSVALGAQAVADPIGNLGVAINANPGFLGFGASALGGGQASVSTSKSIFGLKGWSLSGDISAGSGPAVDLAVSRGFASWLGPTHWGPRTVTATVGPGIGSRAAVGSVGYTFVPQSLSTNCRKR
jgi:RHS repeat-associated protein